MTNSTIHSNLPLQRSSYPVRAAVKKPRGLMQNLSSAASAIGQGIASPFYAAADTYRWGRKHVRYLTSAAAEPQDALKRIDSLSREGLMVAASYGIKKPDVTGPLQAGLDDRIQEVRATKNNRQANRQSALPPDYWKTKADEGKTKFCERVSAFTAFLQMRAACGIVEKNNLTLMGLVKSATEELGEGENAKSIWTLFVEKYQDKLSFVGKIKAAFCYWLYYKSSLISNTVDTYVTSFLEGLTKDLTRPESTARDELFSIILEDADRFLVNDRKATKKFSTDKHMGTLPDLRNEAIERQFKYPISEQINRFIRKRIENDRPNVPFLYPFFEKIPVLNYIFKGFDAFVNRFIVQRMMQSWILPGALQSVVENGLKATEMEDSPFTLSLTKFLTSRLVQLKELLEALEKSDGGSSINPGDDPVNGTKLLSTTLQDLRAVLELEPHTTAIDLRRKFEELEKASKNENKWYWPLQRLWNWENKKIEDGIEQGAVMSGNLLFRYLNETTKSGELVATLLENASAPFLQEEKSIEQIRSAYKQEKKKLERLSDQIFKKAREIGVDRVMNLDKHQNTKEIVNQAFEDQKTISTEIFAKLTELCERMKIKIERAAKNPSSENSVQSDICAFLQIMQVFGNRDELQNRLDNLSSADKNEIWRLVTPLYEKAAEIQEKILDLQAIQKEFTKESTAESHMIAIRDLLKSMKEKFPLQPIQLGSPLIQSLQKYQQEVVKNLDAEDATSTQLKDHVSQIAKISKNIVAEQQVIDAVTALYPMRREDGLKKRDGLLVLMLNYYEGQALPTDFTPRACREQIKKYLAQFETNEREELERLIGNGSNLRANWGQIGIVLQKIYENQMGLKNQDQNLLIRTVDTASKWAQKIEDTHSAEKVNLYGDLKDKMGAIRSDLASLTKKTERANIHFSSFTPSIAVKAAGAIGLPAFLGALLGPAASAIPFVGSTIAPAATTIGTGIAAAATGLGIAVNPLTQNYGEMRSGKVGAMLRTAAVISGGIAAAAFVPAAASLMPASVTGYMAATTAANLSSALTATAAAGLAGHRLQTAANNYAKERILPKVQGLYNNLQEFIQHPRLWKALSRGALERLG